MSVGGLKAGVLARQRWEEQSQLSHGGVGARLQRQSESVRTRAARTCVGDLHRLTHMPAHPLSARYLRPRGRGAGERENGLRADSTAGRGGRAAQRAEGALGSGHEKAQKGSQGDAQPWCVAAGVASKKPRPPQRTGSTARMYGGTGREGRGGGERWGKES